VGRGFQKGHLFYGGRRRGAKNRIKEANKYREVEREKLKFKGSYAKFIEFVRENPDVFYRIFYNQEPIKVIELGNQQQEFQL
jgi:hypothetical protein